MQELKKVHRALDRIMDLQHRIVNTIVDFAERECNKELIREIEYGLLEKEFEMLADYYSQLRDVANDYKEVRYKEKTEMFGYQTVGLSQEESKDAKSDDSLILDVRDEMLSYIREAYTDMCYLTDIDADVYSIYDGERQEKIRLLEYESYTQNIHVNEHKDMFEDLDGNYTNLPFWARASIIEELANTDSYVKSYTGMCKIVESIDNDDEKYDKLLPEEKEELRKRLIYKKYEELYLMLNQRYNGMLTNEMGITYHVGNAIKMDALPFFLGIPRSELKANHDPKVEEYIAGIKEEVSEELRDVTKNRRYESVKVKPRKIKGLFSKDMLAKGTEKVFSKVKSSKNKKSKKEDRKIKGNDLAKKIKKVDSKDNNDRDEK